MLNLPYWSSIPRYIRFSKILTDEEKSLCYLINDYMNEAGYCCLSNKEFAKKLNVSERTISNRIASIEDKGFINVYQNQHLHKRIIYSNRPKRITEIEPKPTEKELEPKTLRLIEGLKKGLILGEMDVKVLLERVIDTGVLAKIEDNSRQFAVDEGQLDFLLEMKKLKKSFDCQIANYHNIDFERLLKAIKESDFLMSNSNLGLKFMLENSEKIINGDYRNYGKAYKPNFTGRNYSPGELNSVFQNVDDIEI